MAKHHILCIHGIGAHTNTWVKDKDDKNQSFEELFKEIWDGYPRLKGKIGQLVELHSIHYDDEITKICQSWVSEAEKLKKGLASSPLLLGEVDWFTGAIDDASAGINNADWQYTHLMDLLMFLSSPSIQDRLVTYVGNQIIKLIEANGNDNFSLIGHSMGTAMAHKVIQALFNEGVEMPDGSRQTLKGHFRFQNVCMVANTSYSLSRDRKKHYNPTVVRPTATVGKGCCNTWINVNHKLDPVGRFMPFNYREDSSWLDPLVDTAGFHDDIMPTRISSPNIHSINHYFRDPVVYMPYFDLTFDATLPAAIRKQQIEKFDDTTPEGKYKSLRSHLQVMDVSNKSSMSDLFKAILEFRDLIKDFH